MKEKIYREIHDKTWQEVGELVRCKDCKRYDGRLCEIVDWYNTADDYCSRAERRTDE